MSDNITWVLRETTGDPEIREKWFVHTGCTPWRSYPTGEFWRRLGKVGEVELPEGKETSQTMEPDTLELVVWERVELPSNVLVYRGPEEAPSPPLPED